MAGDEGDNKKNNTNNNNDDDDDDKDVKAVSPAAPAEEAETVTMANEEDGDDGDDGDDDVDSILPPVTQAMRDEYAREVLVREANATNSANSANAVVRKKVPTRVCGIPLPLLLALLALTVLVIVGTVLAVIFYNPDAAGVFPPSESPSLAPSSEAP